jgi:DNA-binding CsgD family transcriptional regulator
MRRNAVISRPLFQTRRPTPNAMQTPTAHSLTDNEFDRIVAGLYDAATGGAEWSAALEPVRQTFGARTTVLHTLDIADGRVLSLHATGQSMERIAYDYVADWERRDPRKFRLLRLGAAGLDRWLHCSDEFDAGYRERDPFFRDFLPGCEIPLDERIVTGFVLELHASRGPLDADERELARRFGEHMRQALISHERMRRLAAQTLVGHQLLQAFPYPMWLVDADRGIHFANAAASAVEAVEEPLRRQLGRLRLADPALDRQLSVELHGLMALPHHTRRPMRLGACADTGDNAQWLHLAVLDAREVMGQAFGPHRYVLATLFRPSDVSALDPFALAQMFDLTPAVARVASMLAEGMEPAAIAERLNIRLSTVRTHVREVLAALGQKRITDVVRVLRQGEALWALGPDRR